MCVSIQRNPICSETGQRTNGSGAEVVSSFHKICGVLYVVVSQVVCKSQISLVDLMSTELWILSVFHVVIL